MEEEFDEETYETTFLSEFELIFKKEIICRQKHRQELTIKRYFIEVETTETIRDAFKRQYGEDSFYQK